MVVTPDGFPLDYEVMDGNHSDKTKLREFPGKMRKMKPNWLNPP